MNEPRENALRVGQWVEKADRDLKAAEYMLTLKEDCPFDVICFHAQQCAEKYVKALLIHSSVDFPKTHDLVVLLRLASKTGDVHVQMEDLQPLNRYAIEARYPGDWEPITRADAEEAVAIARRIRTEIRRFLP